MNRNEDIKTIPTLLDATQQFLQSLKLKNKSKETIKSYESRLKQLHAYLKKDKNAPVYVDMITEQKLDELVFADIKLNKLSNRTINHKVSAISSFCTFAVRKGWLTYNPTSEFERLPIKKEERPFLTEDEIHKVIEHIKHPIGMHVIYLMVYTGLRISEATNLTLQHVDFEEKIIKVIDGKGGKDRKVPMNTELEKILQKYLKEVRPNVASLNFFATEKTGGISPQYVNRLLKEAAKSAGIGKNITSHALRHSFASMLVKNNLHVAIISKLLGHADVRTTSIYMHAHQSELENAVNTIKL